MEHHYTTIGKRSVAEYKEKGSKFIAIADVFNNAELLKEYLNEIQKQYPRASHYCYAFSIGTGQNKFRYNDDREPSGSAGKPIYGAILSAQVTNVIVVVVRYFGGTQLGIPGLTQAYKTAAREALDLAGKRIEEMIVKFKVTFPIDFADVVLQAVKSRKGTLIHYKAEIPSAAVCEMGTEHYLALKQLFLNEHPFIGIVDLTEL
ncbi:MAG TPA: YigZ family protein [Bacteroidia bacterium]|nr:YigZ family protein [Bacteroidia bacterium]